MSRGSASESVSDCVTAAPPDMDRAAALRRPSCGATERDATGRWVALLELGRAQGRTTGVGGRGAWPASVRCGRRSMRRASLGDQATGDAGYRSRQPPARSGEARCAGRVAGRARGLVLAGARGAWGRTCQSWGTGDSRVLTTGVDRDVGGRDASQGASLA